MSINDWIFVLTLFAALGCGLVAGVFFAFSAFIMKALARLPSSEGTAAMQAINLTVVNPLFLGVFLGTAMLSVLLVISALLQWQDPASFYLLVGSSLYLVGSLLVTIVFNIPKNEALAAVVPGDPTGPGFWKRYLVDWTVWNHLRMVAALAATTAFILALCH